MRKDRTGGLGTYNLVVGVVVAVRWGLAEVDGLEGGGTVAAVTLAVGWLVVGGLRSVGRLVVSGLRPVLVGRLGPVGGGGVVWGWRPVDGGSTAVVVLGVQRHLVEGGGPLVVRGLEEGSRSGGHCHGEAKNDLQETVRGYNEFNQNIKYLNKKSTRIKIEFSRGSSDDSRRMTRQYLDGLEGSATFSARLDKLQTNNNVHLWDCWDKTIVGINSRILYILWIKHASCLIMFLIRFEQFVK